VQVPYDEGVAIHIGPESYAVAREGLGEALTDEVQLFFGLKTQGADH
jgi:hypothetical protein